MELRVERLRGGGPVTVPVPAGRPFLPDDSEAAGSCCRRRLRPPAALVEGDPAPDRAPTEGRSGDGAPSYNRPGPVRCRRRLCPPTRLSPVRCRRRPRPPTRPDPPSTARSGGRGLGPRPGAIPVFGALDERSGPNSSPITRPRSVARRRRTRWVSLLRRKPVLYNDPRTPIRRSPHGRGRPVRLTTRLAYLAVPG
jgi:hypothetical protein